jgi:hypothetical protein
MDVRRHQRAALFMQMLTCTHCGGFTPHDTSRTCLHCDAPLRRPPRWARRLSVLLGPAGAILLAACYGAPGRYYNARGPMGPGGATRVDNDRDGAFGPWICPPHVGPSCEAEVARMGPPPDLDCDDNDPRRYPGAQDLEGDGIDQNCDGVDGWRDPNTAVSPYATPPSDEPAHVTVPAPTP